MARNAAILLLLSALVAVSKAMHPDLAVGGWPCAMLKMNMRVDHALRVGLHQGNLALPHGRELQRYACMACRQASARHQCSGGDG